MFCSVDFYEQIFSPELSSKVSREVRKSLTDNWLLGGVCEVDYALGLVLGIGLYAASIYSIVPMDLKIIFTRSSTSLIYRQKKSYAKILKAHWEVNKTCSSVRNWPLGCEMTIFTNKTCLKRFPTVFLRFRPLSNVVLYLIQNSSWR